MYLVEPYIARHNRIEGNLHGVWEQLHQAQHPRHLLDKVTQLCASLAGFFETGVEVMSQ